MAQKRPSTVEQQPSPSTSDQDHEQEPSSSSSSSSSSEEEEDEDDHEPAPPPAPAPHATTAITTKKPPSKKPQPPLSPSVSATDSGSNSDSESESDNPPAPAPNPKPKPEATKPFEDSPKPKKPKPQPQLTATPPRSASKRPGENNLHVSEPKRAKKKASDASGVSAAGGGEEDEVLMTEEGGKKKTGNDSKKLFQRIWSEEDEIAILKGLAEFTSRTGVDPYKDANAFHDFIKKSLRAESSSNQLKEKIRRLKKKFENNAGRGKNGEEPKFSKPHEQKAFELSKKIWANGGVEPAKSDSKTKNNSKEGNSSKNVPAPKLIIEPVPKDSKENEQEKGVDENADESTWNLSGLIQFDNLVGVSGLKEDVLKRGLRLIEASKRAELEERWKSLQVAELELYVNRAELIRDQARLIWEAYKSSNN